MEIEDFSYFRCLSCGNKIILPMSYHDNHRLLSNMSHDYTELNECCDDAYVTFGSLEFGINNGYIKISDLPLVLRKEFPSEVIHKFECGKHSLVVNRHNGNKVTVTIDNNNLIIDNGMTNTFINFMDD